MGIASILVRYFQTPLPDTDDAYHLKSAAVPKKPYFGS